MRRYVAKAIAVVGFVLGVVGLFDGTRRYLLQIGAPLMITALYLDRTPAAPDPGRE